MTTQKNSRTLSVLLTLALVATAFVVSAAQHGATSEDEHFDALAARLELTEAQRETLKAPIGEAVAAIQTLHRLHDVIAADLTEAQRQQLRTLVRDALGSMAGGEGNHGHARHR